MDSKAMQKISYGLYVITTKEREKDCLKACSCYKQDLYTGNKILCLCKEVVTLCNYSVNCCDYFIFFFFFSVHHFYLCLL